MADISEDLTEGDKISKRNARKCAHVSKILMREEYKAQMKKVTEILKKCEPDRTPEEIMLLEQSPDLVKSIEKRHKLRQLNKHRQLEIEDNEEELGIKCHQLAQAIRAAKYVVLYTGAGISTAASIPDYRGPSGVWTLLQQGIQPKVQDLSMAEPTYTHMAIKKLHQMGVVKHVVSQNCDGLHLRSGLPRHILSELHGNMFIEVCHSCQPQQEYVRLFDVTERTGVRKHGTGRSCPRCGQELRDSIVHFGERSPGLASPYNWEEAAQAADQADLVLCIGSSLKVLKKYPCLWSPHKPASQKPSLYIVNLQWTPKDESAVLKINAKCDVVLQKLLKHLGLTADSYNPCIDPLYCLATPLTSEELKTTTRNILAVPANYNRSAVLSNIQHEQLRSLEQRKKKGKKKRGGKEGDQAYSNFYEEKMCAADEEVESKEMVEGKVYGDFLSVKGHSEGQGNTGHSEGQGCRSSTQGHNYEQGHSMSGHDPEAAYRSAQGHWQREEEHFQDEGQIKTGKEKNEYVPHHETSGPSPTDSKLASPSELANSQQAPMHKQHQEMDRGSTTEWQPQATSIPSTSTPYSLSYTLPFTNTHSSQATQSSPANQLASFPSYIPSSLPLGPGFLPGSPLFPFPMALPATSPDLTQHHDLESVKFHQTLQMLQFQSQLHMHQQALTQQLPPAEQAKIRQQQDIMRQAFNSLLLQQLIKLEQRDIPMTTVSTSVSVPNLLSPSMLGRPMVSGLWPPMAMPSAVGQTMYPFMCPPPQLVSQTQTGSTTYSSSTQQAVAKDGRANTHTTSSDGKSSHPQKNVTLRKSEYNDSKKGHHDNVNQRYDVIKGHYDSKAEVHDIGKEHYDGPKGHYDRKMGPHDTVRDNYDGSKDHYDSVKQIPIPPSICHTHIKPSTSKSNHTPPNITNSVSATCSNASVLSNSYPTIVSALHGSYNPMHISQQQLLMRPQSYQNLGLTSLAGSEFASTCGNSSHQNSLTNSLLNAAKNPAYTSPSSSTHYNVTEELSRSQTSEIDSRSYSKDSYSGLFTSMINSSITYAVDTESQTANKRKKRKKKPRQMEFSQPPLLSPTSYTHNAYHANLSQTLSNVLGLPTTTTSDENLHPGETYHTYTTSASTAQYTEKGTENSRVRVEGLAAVLDNPMIAIQSRLLAEEGQGESYVSETEPSLHPVPYSSLFPSEAHIVETQYPDASDLGVQQEVIVGTPSTSPSDVIYNNVALVETVTTESDNEDLSTPAVNDEVSMEADSSPTSESSTTASSSSPITLSTPGWFGKGWNSKKYKRRKKSK